MEYFICLIGIILTDFKLKVAFNIISTIFTNAKLYQSKTQKKLVYKMIFWGCGRFCKKKIRSDKKMFFSFFAKNIQEFIKKCVK